MSQMSRAALEVKNDKDTEELEFATLPEMHKGSKSWVGGNGFQKDFWVLEKGGPIFLLFLHFWKF